MTSKQFESAVRILRTVLLVGFFYTFSISLTFYNKWLVKNFHFPLTVSVTHYAFVFLVAVAARRVWEIYTKKRRVVLPWRDYAKRVFVPAIAGSLDIGLSNWSLMFVTISLYTMTKSTSIIFLLVFAIIFKLEVLRMTTLGVVGLISAGLLMFTYESTQFNATGFTLALSASFLGGIRWTTIQLLMQKESSGLNNPFDAIYHLQPVMALALVPLAMVVEGPRMSSSQQLWLASSWSDVTSTCARVGLGAFLALMLTISEYLLVRHTSGLGLAIAGILKEICTLSIASEFGGDRLTSLNFIGLVICMSGICLHVFTKAMRAPSTTLKEGDQSNIDTMPLRNNEEFPLLHVNHSSDEEDMIFSAKL